jgi:hypothetical protein
MRFDKLYVESKAPAKDFDRGELVGRPVTVVVQRARGKEVTVKGKVVHVGQEIESGGLYAVRAEIDNIEEGNSWAVQPSLARATMTIHLGE